MTSTQSTTDTPPARLAYSPSEAAELVGLSRSRLYEEIASRRLRSLKVGERRLIPADALTQWLVRLGESE